MQVGATVQVGVVEGEFRVQRRVGEGGFTNSDGVCSPGRDCRARWHIWYTVGVRERLGQYDFLDSIGANVPGRFEWTQEIAHQVAKVPVISFHRVFGGFTWQSGCERDTRPTWCDHCESNAGRPCRRFLRVRLTDGSCVNKRATGLRMAGLPPQQARPSPVVRPLARLLISITFARASARVE